MPHWGAGMVVRQSQRYPMHVLTTENPATWKDNDLLQRLGMHVAPAKPASRSATIAAQ